MNLEQDVIEPVTEPTKGVSLIILAPKSDGTYRLCVDPRRANQAVLSEKHPIPAIEEFEPELKDAKVFSKIDLRHSYHQILLALEFREITTFSTHVGLFRFKRLFEVLSCAPEKFQRLMETLLSGLEGVLIFLDDLVVYGKDKAEHDVRLAAVLKKL